jgi:hypothetical protein
MKHKRLKLISLLPAVMLCSVLCGCGSNPQAGSGGSPATSENQGQRQISGSQTDISKQQKEVEQRARPEIEERRKQAQQEAEKAIDKEAMAAIAETQAAVNSLANNNRDDAMKAIENANGKINTLLGRYPAAALIPLSAEVDVIDLAPQDLDAIRAVTDVVDTAVRTKDYPAARLLLHGLTSELRVRTYNLPLASYPNALTEAARLLDQNKNTEASSVLLEALNTLAIVDRADPLPLLVAQNQVNEAQNLRDKDKNMALNLLSDSQRQLERAKELGYARNDPEYEALNKSISDLEKQLKGNGDTLQAFSNLKNRLETFLKRQFDTTRRSRQT